MFNQQELQILLGGVNAPVDVQDLRAHTQYGGLYDNDEPTIQAFWKVRIFKNCDCIINLNRHL
jgi:ubiquitin-protein ligase E3 C